MANKKTARRAFISSVISLILCCCMLVGTTFAWFTDEVVSSGNIIQSGNLTAGLYYGETAEAITNNAATGTIFNYELWEPGYTMVKYVKITNEGNLAFKFRLDIIPNAAPEAGEPNLADVIDVYLFDAVEVTREDIAAATPVGTLSELMADADGAAYGELLPAEGSGHSTNVNTDDAPVGEISYCIALKMQETAGNEYQDCNVGGGFSVRLMATQYTWEKDSFDHNYDILSAYPGTGKGQLNTGAAAVEIPVFNSADTKIGSVVVPAGAVADPELPIEVIYDESDYEGNFTVDTGMETKVVDVTVLNLKPDNTVPVKAYLYIPAGLDPNTVKLYHYDTEIDCTYNPTTGYVIFEATQFSPFTVVYKAESVYEPTDPEGENLPVANVERSSEYENTELNWGSYGAWSPTEGLDSQLEAAYTFSCKDTPEAAEKSDYANWYCDFYVKLDKDLGANQIFLGGNYGSFGWVGFHNGDLTLEANTEIPLLGSVTSNPWTYAQVAETVGTFICGVGDVEDALSGATFTVMLRLTNPADETEFYNVATINYTFE